MLAKADQESTLNVLFPNFTSHIHSKLPLKCLFQQTDGKRTCFDH